MSLSRFAPTLSGGQRPLRQILIGLLALPLSALPFLAYINLTPEGRLVRDKAKATLAPPKLPSLNPEEQRAAANAAPRYQGRVMALVYHGVGSGSDGEGGYVVSPERFGEHLATLRAAGMQAVTAAEVAAAFATGQPLPDRAVLITFDDGRTDAMLFADPLLAQAGMKATMFVISGAASDPGIYYSGWKRLAAAHRSGRWDLQAHTHALHRMQPTDGGEELPALTSLAPGETPAAYRQRIGEDLDRSNRAITAHTGRRPAAFAYPFGAWGADRTNHPAIPQILREEIAKRYVVAFQQDEQGTIPLINTTADALALRRLDVKNWSGLELLHRITEAAGPTTTDTRGESMLAIAPARP